MVSIEARAVSGRLGWILIKSANKGVMGVQSPKSWGWLSQKRKPRRLQRMRPQMHVIYALTQQEEAMNGAEKGGRGKVLFWTLHELTVKIHLCNMTWMVESNIYEMILIIFFRLYCTILIESCQSLGCSLKTMLVWNIAPQTLFGTICQLRFRHPLMGEKSPQDHWCCWGWWIIHNTILTDILVEWVTHPSVVSNYVLNVGVW